MAEPTPIAYVTTTFPALTETAVMKEMAAIDSPETPIIVYAMRGSFDIFDGKYDDKALRFKDRTVYLTKRMAARGALSHSHRLSKAQPRYLKMLGTVAVTSGTPEKIAKNYAALWAALGWLSDMEARGIRYLHGNFAAYQTTAAWAVHMLTGMPYGFSAHAYDIFDQASMLKAKTDHASLVVPISDYNRRYMVDELDLPEDNMHVVRCGVDVRQFDPTLRNPRGDGRVLAVARLDEKKGLEYLVDAAGELKRRGRNIHVDIIGFDPDNRSEDLKSRATAQGVGENVVLHGPVSQEELWTAYREADIFALPCITARDGAQDGIPATLMEAMAQGVPTVSTIVSGIPELVIDGETGRLVPQKDGFSLADVIGELLDDPEQAASLGRAGRAHVLAEFDAETNARRLGGLIKDVIASHHGPHWG